MVICSVLGCESDSEKKGCGIAFYEFPSNPLTEQFWIKACGRNNWQPEIEAVICSLHFDIEEDSTEPSTDDSENKDQEKEGDQKNVSVNTLCRVGVFMDHRARLQPFREIVKLLKYRVKAEHLLSLVRRDKLRAARELNTILKKKVSKLEKLLKQQTEN